VASHGGRASPLNAPRSGAGDADAGGAGLCDAAWDGWGTALVGGAFSVDRGVHGAQVAPATSAAVTTAIRPAVIATRRRPLAIIALADPRPR